MLSAEDTPPSDRPNLSKDYLAGQAKDDWIPLRSPKSTLPSGASSWCSRHVSSSIDVSGQQVLLDGGAQRSFGSLLIRHRRRSGASPIPGADGPQVHYLRSSRDSRDLVDKARSASTWWSSRNFIGLEVSASLRSRGIAVDVVAPDHVPLERVMGQEVGRFVQTLARSTGCRLSTSVGRSLASTAGPRRSATARRSMPTSW
jgi:NAD(P)H-nitrite reductase large subunit